MDPSQRLRWEARLLAALGRPRPPLKFLTRQRQRPLAAPASCAPPFVTAAALGVKATQRLTDRTLTLLPLAAGAGAAHRRQAAAVTGLTGAPRIAAPALAPRPGRLMTPRVATAAAGTVAPLGSATTTSGAVALCALLPPGDFVGRLAPPQHSAAPPARHPPGDRGADLT